MTNEEIIDGLKFTMEMCLYNSTDGSMRPVSTLNDMDKTTYDACKGAIELLKQQPCEDCISREEFERRIKPYDTEDKTDKALYNFAHNTLIGCPSVTPRTKSEEAIHAQGFVEGVKACIEKLNEMGG